MSDSMVRKWVRQFNEGRSEVHDEERSGRPSLITEELAHAIHEKIKENRQTINAAVYCETLGKLRRAIQNKRRGFLSKGVVFLLDNARPHTANVTKTLLRGFDWDVFDHPPYSPDLAPSDFHLFLHLKSFLAGKHFNNGKELK
ncbi:histone-lysine N-methyltransferase SETMAR [Trichonephila clavipes]|nr:histone-lysine N-methyltransferase SETMAR [Trichonephila clavipes]